MSGKQFWGWTVLVSALTSAGCCSWCDKHCSHPATACAPVCVPAAPACVPYTPAAAPAAAVCPPGCVPAAGYPPTYTSPRGCCQ